MADGPRHIQPARFQVSLDLLAMRFRGDHNAGISRAQGHSDEASHFTGEKGVALVELNYVPFLIAIVPVLQRLVHFARLSGLGCSKFHGLKLAH